MQQALAGQGDTLAALSDFYTKRKPDGSYAENSSEANVPVNCLDHPQDVSVDEILANRDEFVDGPRCSAGSACGSTTPAPTGR